MTYHILSGTSLSVGSSTNGRQRVSGIHCLTDVEGNPVRSVYSKKRVCYSGKTSAPRVPVPRSSHKTCLSIYDIYNRRVCYFPIPVKITKPRIVSTYTTRTPEEVFPVEEAPILQAQIVVKKEVTLPVDLTEVEEEEAEEMEAVLLDAAEPLPILMPAFVPESITPIAHRAPQAEEILDAESTPVFQQVPVDTEPSSEEAQLFDTSENLTRAEGKKKLIIGGIIAAVVVGGVVIAMGRKK